jgi:hypothetical protein
MILGLVRASRAPRGTVVVNERVHPSVYARFGAHVHELKAGVTRTMIYAPRNVRSTMRRR